MTTISRTLGTLDALAAAAREGNVSAYRDALEVANKQGLTSEQILDAYQWGRRGKGSADFDVAGQLAHPKGAGR